MRSSLGQVMTALQMTNRCSFRIRDNTNCAQGRVREATLGQSHHISQVFSYKRDSGPICGAQTQTKKDLVQVNAIVSPCENVFGKAVCITNGRGPICVLVKDQSLSGCLVKSWSGFYPSVCVLFLVRCETSFRHSDVVIPLHNMREVVNP